MPKQKFDRTPIVSGEEILKNADKEILQDFLYILVNYYPMAKNSILSLENETDEISLSAIMQLRDFIDHTYLAMSIHEDMKIDMKKHQISNAAEHLRRSIVEPYQRKILDCIKEIKDYYTIYKKSPFRLLHRYFKAVQNNHFDLLRKTISGKYTRKVADLNRCGGLAL